jgi:outer membrane protein insertion porin family
MKSGQGVLVVLLWLISLPALAITYKLEQISISGNDTTHAEVILKELGFSAGETIDHNDIALARKMLMSLGLFRSVKTSLYPAGDAYRLLIKVKEKIFFVPVPIMNISGDGDRTYGITARNDNFLGLNQEFKASLRRKDYHKADIEYENRLELLYRAPKALVQTADIELGFYSERVRLDERRGRLSGQYQRALTSSRFLVSAPIPRETMIAETWSVSLGFERQTYDHWLISGDPGLFFDTEALTLIVGVRNSNLELLSGWRKGWEYGYDIRRTVSDGNETYQSQGFFKNYRHGFLLDFLQVNSRAHFGWCSGSIFGDPCFGLGGDSTIRGVTRSSVEGNSFILGNIQLLTPLQPGNKLIKGTVFADLGMTMPEKAENRKDNLVVGFGVGLVWKLRWFVRTDIRLEVARGVRKQDKTRLYGATSLLF